MQQKMELKIRTYAVIVTEVFAQIGASVIIKERVQPETQALNVEILSKNSATIEDNLTISCAKYIWGKV